MKITADFSHWVCVTESFLENYEAETDEAIRRTAHIHARIGFTQGPQIPDPRSPFWQKETDLFLGLWGKILMYQQSIGMPFFTITPEFGPPPYMWTTIDDNSPVSNQWDINLFMMNLLRDKFS